jgi:hypothetical protein
VAFDACAGLVDVDYFPRNPLPRLLAAPPADRQAGQLWIQEDMRTDDVIRTGHAEPMMIVDSRLSESASM